LGGKTTAVGTLYLLHVTATSDVSDDLQNASNGMPLKSSSGVTLVIENGTIR